MALPICNIVQVSVNGESPECATGGGTPPVEMNFIMYMGNPEAYMGNPEGAMGATEPTN